MKVGNTAKWDILTSSCQMFRELGDCSIKVRLCALFESFGHIFHQKNETTDNCKLNENERNRFSPFDDLKTDGVLK